MSCHLVLLFLEMLKKIQEENKSLKDLLKVLLFVLLVTHELHSKILDIWSLLPIGFRMSGSCKQRF